MMEHIIEEASSYASEVDGLILLVAILVGFWFFVAEGILFYFIFKYRRSKVKRADYVTGEKKEEMKWIHLPHNLVLLCDIAIIIVAVKVWYDIKQDHPPADETVRVIGQQWAWTFVHPGEDGKLGTDDDITKVNELHVKVDTTYHFKLESVDVLHDFSVPVFRLKHDALPGRVHTGWFKPTKTGTYDIQCAEMCGIGHGIMGAKIVIETKEEHDKWIAENQS